MRLFADWAREEKAPKPAVLTVDHGLRSRSPADADRVVDWAKDLGLSASVLRWEGKKPKANLEDAAREARYRLMGEWCKSRGIAALFVAHTRDDQAETFLLRLGRGSGVDGLSAMRARAPYPLPCFGIELFRPLLGFSRDDLRAYLSRDDIQWLEDPMNADPRFARVRLRNLMPALAEAGVPAERVAAAAAHLARAREALERQADNFIAHHAKLERSGTVLIDGAALSEAPREVGLRVFAALLMRVSGEKYRPRFERLEAAFDGLTAPGFRGRTLGGCKIARAARGKAVFGPATLVIGPESARREGARPAPPAKVKVARLRTNLPRKGRNMAVSCNS